jgi:hypothetical protein
VKALARLIGLGGAVAIGLFLFRAAPRQIELVYDVSRSPGATSVEVELRQGGQLVRRAELAVPASGQVHHRLELPDGAYELAWQVSGAAGSPRGVKPVEVREAGTIVLALGP